MATKATKAPLTKVEIKEAKAALKQALLNVNNEFAKFVADNIAAAKNLTVAKKEADKAVAAAQKAYDASLNKRAKAEAVAIKGREKVAAQLAALEPVKAEPVEVVEE